MSQIRTELTEVMIARRRLDKVQRHYDRLTERHARESVRMKEMSLVLRKEERDVEKLERTGVRSLFLRILGDKDKQLEKERQEYLQIALEYNEISKSLELIDYELDLLERKLANRSNIDNRYQDLIHAMEHELLSSGSEAGEKLLSITKKLEQNQVLLRDIDEAIDAGLEANSLIQKLEKRLKEARDWGHWDMYGSDGGGWLKHRAIDRAREYLHRVRHALIRFENELRDVYPDARINVDVRIDRIDNFFDVFFDNLISDWIVQQRIVKAMEHISTTRRQLATALRDLEAAAPQVQDDIRQLQREREKVIVMG